MREVPASAIIHYIDRVQLYSTKHIRIHHIKGESSFFLFVHTEIVKFGFLTELVQTLCFVEYNCTTSKGE